MEAGEIAKELQELSKVLSYLTQREFRVITLRFGLIDKEGRQGNGKGLTLQDIANDFCVTGERIRQIERKALIKLAYTANKLKGGKNG